MKNDVFDTDVEVEDDMQQQQRLMDHSEIDEDDEQEALWELKISPAWEEEEEQELADHMKKPIVAKGKLQVVGTNQHLKDNYGSGYLLQLNLVQSSDESMETALHFVRDNVDENAAIATKQAKTIHINSPRDVSVEKVFTVLYSDAATGCGINQFLVSQSSLEDVLIALGE